MVEITVQKNVPATMRDGTTLMSDVYRPAEGGPDPILLARLPYGKDRGSDGTVGMHGLSYFGKIQWHAAVMRPPSLKSLAPVQTWGNHLNGVQMRGGVQELGLMQFWAQTSLTLDLLFRKYARDRGRIRKKLPELISTIDELLAGGGYDVLPLKDLPNPDELAPFVAGGFGRGVDDEAWHYLNIHGKYESVDVPTFHVGGWYDCFIGETLRQYETIKKLSDERGMRPPRLMVGPWTHGSFESTLGDLDLGIGSSGSFLDYGGDLTDTHLCWFDTTLNGDEGALEATLPVRLFVMGENRWRSYEEWPPPSRARRGGICAPTARCAANPVRRENEPARYDYDPDDPVPTVGGPILMADIHRPGPMDQRGIEVRSDVLVYTGPLLGSPYTVLGPAYVTLFAASSAPDTDFVARLVDVYPDERAICVADGILRASARESYSAPGVVRPVAPSPIEPGEVYEYVIDLWATGITFLPGHRMRVQVTSSSHPRWERNLNTGEGAFRSSRTEVARQTVFHDAGRPSKVPLTVVEG
jgi:putative CocE/NonD family hydrolase